MSHKIFIAYNRTNQMTKKKSIDQMVHIFRSKKIMTKEEFIKLLKCTGRTVQRRLKSWQAITSYNKNGKYYTLPEVATFNHFGIWHHRDASFSQYGNLIRTVIQLINTSDAGLTGQELGDILRLTPRSFLSHFRKNESIYREKLNGRFVYYSVDDKQFKKQKIKRLEREKLITTKLPSDKDAVMILVAFIKHPDWSSHDIASNLLAKGISCSHDAIEHLFIHHDLVKKKV